MRSPNAAGKARGPATAAVVMLAALVAVPLLWVLARALATAAQPTGWLALRADPQWLPALGISLLVGVLATTLSAVFTAVLIAGTHTHPAWSRLMKALPPALATPHAAFAIGFAFLIAPSGWALRLVSPSLTGLVDPPPWPLTQDPWGLGLVAVLVLKEVPYLLWSAASQLQRDDVRERWPREWRLAQTLGYSAASAWWRVIAPQLTPRLLAPLLAVLAYSLTVVDVALIIGPTTPPTLAALAWQWLLDADPEVNAKGAAAAMVLAAAVAAGAALLSLLVHLRWGHRRRLNGQRGRSQQAQHRRGRLARAGLAAGAGLYALVGLLLLLSSSAGSWPFPDAWPEQWTVAAWQSVWAASGTLLDTLSLALVASTIAMGWALAWLDLATGTWDSGLRRLLLLPLMLPSVLWVIGLHRLSLDLGVDGRWAGVLLAHVLACLPYVLIALTPAFLGFDRRHAQVAYSLGHSHARFLLRVKWPLLRASIASAWAVGVAVSVAQYLPTLYVGAGRVSTVTTEAVTLASGGQRSLLAAFATLQWLLPALGFAVAVWWGRPRRFTTRVGSGGMPGGFPGVGKAA